jgi:thiol:disulfide interchange protein
MLRPLVSIDKNRIFDSEVTLHRIIRDMHLKLLSVFPVLLCFAAMPCTAQTAATGSYDPDADAEVQLDRAIEEACRQGKHILVVIGGNWCSWCRKLDGVLKNDTRIDSILSSDYVLLHINYSKENRNPHIMERLQHPERFGFPVLVFLDGSGRRIHTQDSGLLERDGVHDAALLSRCLHLWGPSALKDQASR